MKDIEVCRVITSAEKKAFLTFPWRIYRDDPLWVPPVLSEREKAVNPQQGSFFQHGDAEFFLAHQGKDLVGTICCAEDRCAHESHPWKDCVIGFFECYSDYAIARALFDHATAWARSRGLDALFGPFNLDYEDSYGVLIEGRDRPPVIFCGHSPAYYQGFFERYGFKPRAGDNIAFAVDLDLAHPEIQRLGRLAEKIRRRGRFRVRSGDLSHWDDEIDRIYSVINRSLAHLPGFLPWRREDLQSIVESLRQFIDPDLILFAETTEDETVGWFPGIPNLNEALIHANGLRYPWNYLQLARNLRRQPECLSVKSILVPPDYWDTGVAALLFDEMARRAASKGYRWIDLSLTSDDNPRTPALAERMGGKIYKRYRVYRKWLNS